MHFSSCPSYLCLKIRCNLFKEVRWDTGGKGPNVTFAAFHLWTVFSEPRGSSYTIKAASICSRNYTVDRWTGVCSLHVYVTSPGFQFLSESRVSNRCKIDTLWGPPSFCEIVVMEVRVELPSTKWAPGRTAGGKGPGPEGRAWLQPLPEPCTHVSGC